MVGGRLSLKTTISQSLEQSCKTGLTVPSNSWFLGVFVFGKEGIYGSLQLLDSTLDLCTRYPLRLGGLRQCGIQSLPDTSTHDQHWELNPRPSDLEANALSTQPRAPTVQITLMIKIKIKLHRNITGSCGK